MAQYRKKPVVVEAEQWFPGREIAGVFLETQEEATTIVGGRGHGALRLPQERRAYVVTIHGQRAYLDPGDWVIVESNPKYHYPCKPAEFERIHEPA